MRNKVAQLFACFLLLLVGVSSSYGQSATSTFNNRSIAISDSSNYSFIVSGHFHGSSKNASGFPAATLLASLSDINKLQTDFMMSLGDLFLSASRDMNNYPRVLFDKLEMPLFNAVGNHDVEDFDYEGNFGDTYFAFDIGSERYIVLNTELDNGHITGSQLSFFKNQVSNLEADGIRNVFIFTHRLIWCEEDDELSPLFADNTRGGTNYNGTIKPLLSDISDNTNIYWFGGSIGGRVPASFFYYEQWDNLFYIATAIRSLPRDGILQVNVNNGKVSFETISLTGRNLAELDFYGVEYFQKHTKEEPFNWRLVPLYIFQMITHRFFWYGIFYAVLGFVTVWFSLKWYKKRKEKKRAAEA